MVRILKAALILNCFVRGTYFDSIARGYDPAFQRNSREREPRSHVGLKSNCSGSTMMREFPDHNASLFK